MRGLEAGCRVFLGVQLDTETERRTYSNAEYLGGRDGKFAFCLGYLGDAGVKETEGPGELVFHPVNGRGRRDNYSLHGRVRFSVHQDWGDKWYLEVWPYNDLLDEVLG